ncbi:hypothetical protein K438DRAFT_1766345 [Mycena galopus ATCC 62051]|nr:hypothetical protein K438DRAFT_1766345 [Mycena galopus ATCC 62051]
MAGQTMELELERKPERKTGLEGVHLTGMFQSRFPGVQLTLEGVLSRHLKGMPQKVFMTGLRLLVPTQGRTIESSAPPSIVLRPPTLSGDLIVSQRKKEIRCEHRPQRPVQNQTVMDVTTHWKNLFRNEKTELGSGKGGRRKAEGGRRKAEGGRRKAEGRR